MRLLRLSALALVAECAYGYLDTTPFFMFSTSELLTANSQLQSSDLLLSDVALSLSSCPSDFYILVSQPGVSSKDYGCKKSTPTLAKALSRSNPRPGVRSSVTVNDVLGPINPSAWREVLTTKCGVAVTSIDASKDGIPTDLTPSPRLLEVVFPAPSSSTKKQDLSSNDDFLVSILDMLPTQNYTVLYTTTTTTRSSSRPGSPVGATELEKTEYQMESSIHESIMHGDLKRDLSAHASNNQTMIDGPLFDKYQFFTPGIFMGFLVGFLLLSILYVAISAVASLQVTYAAFDKEQGALAGTKKQ